MTNMDYNEFAKLLTSVNQFLALLSSPRALGPDMESVASSLVKLSHAMGCTTVLFNVLIRLEFEKAYNNQSQSVIMRGNTLATKCLDRFIQLRSIDFLKLVLLNSLKSVILDESLDFEVDKTYVV